MNRILSIVLSLTLLFSCLGCSRQAAKDQTGNTAVGLQQQEDQTGNIAADLQQPADDSEAEETSAEEPEEPYVRVIDPSKPMVALTFDDGPHPIHSHAILDTLEEHHGVATFFEVAVNIPRCPDALVRMLELGCEIGSHSNVHQDLGKLSQQAMLLDLQTADEAFIAATGKAPTLLRPPYGSVNKAVRMGSGRSVITWNVDTLDWESKDASAVVGYVQSLGDLDGNVLLMHSTYESTAEAVRILIPWLMEQGYQLVTISELLAYYYGELPQPNKFYGYTYFVTHGRTDTPLELPDPNEPVDPVEIPIIEETPAQVRPSTPSVPTTPPQPTQPAAPPAEPTTGESAPSPTPPSAEEPSAEQPGPEQPAPEQPAPGETPPETEAPAPPAETPSADSAAETPPADPPAESDSSAETPPTSGTEIAPPAETPTETPAPAPTVP